MTVQPTEVSIPTADGAMPAQLWFPDQGDGRERPAIVVFQEIFGVSGYVRSRCADLTELGYAVIAPEFYWRLPAGPVPEDADDMLAQGMALMQRFDFEAAVRDGVAVTEHLATLPHVGAIGYLGFCLGGGLACATAAAAPTPPTALVSYYGSALPQLVAGGLNVAVPSLHHFGTADAYIPMDQVEVIRESVTRGHQDVQFELHEGAGHAFDNPHPMFHHASAAEQAWRQTLDFLASRLPVG